MTRLNFHCIYFLSVFFLLATHSFFNPLSANAQTRDVVENEGEPLQLPAGSLAVLPFVKGAFIEKFSAKNLSPLICPINQVCLDLNEGDETPFFMEKLDRNLHRMLQQKLDTSLLPQEDTKINLASLPLNSAIDTYLSISLKLAHKMKADYVLIPILWKFSERVGNEIAAEEAASVSFGLYLVSAKQKKRVWEDYFDKTQHALTDNLFNAKDILTFGGKWITAEELAQTGLEKILKDFPLPPS